MLRIPRRILLPFFARVNLGDISIRHHYTGDRLRLHSFRHRGYWYHGRSREHTTMALFEKLLRPGDTVIEVGGHIGYVALHLARVVGSTGSVVVFEPGPNNLPYIRANIAPHGNIELVEVGVGAEVGKLPLYVESLTGQNNSFVPDFDLYSANLAASGMRAANAEAVLVQVTTLDAFMAQRQLRPTLVKIDVEGFEGEVLRGAESLLRDLRPIVMIEVQIDPGETLGALAARGYRLFAPSLDGVDAADPPRSVQNVFALHRDHHAAIIRRLVG